MRKATVAVAPKTLVVVFHMLQRGVSFADFGGGPLDRVNEHSTVRRLAPRLAVFGRRVMRLPQGGGPSDATVS